MIRILIGSFFVLLCFSCKQEKNTTTQNNTESSVINSNTVENKFQILKTRIDKQLDSINDLNYFNGFGVAVVNKDSILFTKGYGYRDLEKSLPYNSHTIQNIASISKVFVGLTLAKAIEEEKLKLDDNINKYLPFTVKHPLFPKDTIRVQHLVNHTSGISDREYYSSSYINLEKDTNGNPLIDQEELEYFLPIEEDRSLEEFLKSGLTVTDSTHSDYIFNEYKPGTIHEYSNIGAALAAYVVEKATQTDFKDYSKQHVIDELKLKETSWRLSDLDTTLRSKVYSTIDLRYPDYKLITFADGGMYTSVHDLGLVFSEIIAAYQGEGTLLNKDTYKLFFTKSLDSTHLSNKENLKNLKNEQNHGIFLSYEQGRIGHTGGDPGVGTVMFFKPENDFGIIYFVNTDINSKEAMQTFVNITELLESNFE